MRATAIATAVCLLLLACYLALRHLGTTSRGEAVRLAAADTPTVPPAPAKVRRPSVAGAFYPDDPRELAEMVQGFLAKAGDVEVPGKLIALVCPHAGYVYSGPVAGYAYAALKGKQYDTVVLVGFSHRPRAPGVFLPESDQWETPLGRVTIDAALRDQLARDPLFSISDAEMADEHSLEVQVPFLQEALEDFKLLPIQLCDFSLETCGAVSRALAPVIKDKGALLVASTDLSHYPAYDAACRTDEKTLELITSWRLRDLAEWDEQAANSGVRQLYCALCGLGPVLVVMDTALQLGANVAQVLKYANSGDVPAGDKRRCVGYGAVALCQVEGKSTSNAQSLQASEVTEGGTKRVQTSEAELTVEQQTYLLDLARRAINQWVTRRERVEPEKREGILGEKRAVFVTINKHGHLRGCIGTLEPREPLVEAVVSRAIAAATEDPRFEPVDASELPALKIHVSVLSPVRPITDPSEIVIGKHGVIVSQGLRRGVFLPEVAVEQGWDRETMLLHLCAEKAGLEPDAWKKGAKLEVFTTQSFGDKE